jgi:hypothetical protein
VYITPKFDTMSLETLHLYWNEVTGCGVAAFAEGMKGPCTPLKELSLRFCQRDGTGLLKLGEALTINDALEVVDVRNNNFTNNG